MTTILVMIQFLPLVSPGRVNAQQMDITNQPKIQSSEAPKYWKTRTHQQASQEAPKRLIPFCDIPVDQECLLDQLAHVRSKHFQAGPEVVQTAHKVSL